MPIILCHCTADHTSCYRRVICKGHEAHDGVSILVRNSFFNQRLVPILLPEPDLRCNDYPGGRNCLLALYDRENIFHKKVMTE
ncbi:MAG TPA: hypothetical protein G4N92_00725 [Anaerolineae bacterium]|nr:hypothetical protein [Anaerolineae bacterium]